MHRLRGGDVSNEDGLGLVELMIVVLIMGIVGAVAARGIVGGFENTARVQDRLDTLAELQKGEARISRELRAACPVEVIGDHRAELIIFRGGEKYRYVFDMPTGTDDVSLDINRFDTATSAWVDHSSAPVAYNLDNHTTALPLFTWFNADGVGTAVPSEVRSIDLTLRRSGGDDQVLVETTVHIRNGDLACPS